MWNFNETWDQIQIGGLKSSKKKAGGKLKFPVIGANQLWIPEAKKDESPWEPIELGEMCCKLWATVLTTNVFFYTETWYKNTIIQNGYPVVIWHNYGKWDGEWPTCGWVAYQKWWCSIAIYWLNNCFGPTKSSNSSVFFQAERSGSSTGIAANGEAKASTVFSSSTMKPCRSLPSGDVFVDIAAQWIGGSKIEKAHQNCWKNG
jgi:hypothetical protein